MDICLPLLVDGVIALTLLECAALLAFHRLTGAGVGPADFLVNVVAGLCLMLALRCVVRDQHMMWTAMCLLAAGLAHAADIWRRWRRGRTDWRRARTS
ncbi:hypothetical protein [Variovorax rhizosphaerae]|uniref:Uncharacterized protein n=1 Tax=Variovorax rhizosphaerae TaxID=1836200 RepID=A0ABU8WPX9_9BURK